MLHAIASDVGHTLRIDVSAASPITIPNLVKWVVWEVVKVFSDQRLIITQLFYYSTRTTINITPDWSLVDWYVFNQHHLLTLDSYL